MDKLIQSCHIEKCIAIDLEVNRESGQIYRMAALRGDSTDKPFLFSGGHLLDALRELDAFAVGMEFLVGHNIIAFDIPHLQASAPGLRLLELPVIDTLRLSPLAFPRNPYHKLVKHYKDGGLLRFNANDPELDARICLDLFQDEEKAFYRLREENPDLLTAFHWLTASCSEEKGFDHFFRMVRNSAISTDEEGRAVVAACLAPSACVNHGKAVLEQPSLRGWPMAYALAWLSVAGGNSVMPPWVRHEFPEAPRLVKRLRDTRCEDPLCVWCQEHHNSKRVLKHWFGFSEFRPAPLCEDGTPMQEAIVNSAMNRSHVLGILPTGTGKSVCYQVPALSRYENTGALTLVVSPLVALMEDQVRGLRERGITSCLALNGLLSMPERADVLERIRLGDCAVLLVSPEQLRNRGFRRSVEQREIGAWILDEAHCLSKWGQDFRTDYRYVGRFIRESAGKEPLPPVLCLTATAKPDVIRDITDYFQRTMGANLLVFNGGANRDNLDFTVVETTPEHKFSDIHQLLESQLSQDDSGGAIVYCATRKQTEKVAAFLVSMGWPAAHFHAGLTPEVKKTTQKQFIEGEIRVISATNAFGMGIDKPDVRLVIHAEIPGSLENYLQEAGRAGRDQLPARCVLLYCEKDIEQQFGLSAKSQLPLHEIQTVLRALRRMAGRHRPPDKPVEVNATPGEILSNDDENEVESDKNTEDTRVRTAVAWLEEPHLVSREENVYQVFPSSLRVPSLEEADVRLEKFPMPYRGQLRSILKLLISADPREGVTTDELMGASRLSSSGVARAMNDLERCGILSNDSIFTALVHSGVENASRKRMEATTSLESAFIGLLQETEPDLQKGESSVLFLRRVAQRLKDDGYEQALPERLYRLLQSIESDGKSEDLGIGSVRLRKIDPETVQVLLQRDWESLKKTAELRRTGARLLVAHLLACLSPDVRGNDLLVTTTLGSLYAALEADLDIKAQAKDIPRLVERALLWLHEQEIVRLGKGMIVFRPAMRILVKPGNRSFARDDYAELKDHYDEQVVQIHVMAEYARQGLADSRNARQLANDYFGLSREDFISRWFPKDTKALKRKTGDASWKAIVGGLNREQHAIVSDEREKTNVLVLAGPGSGKTRVLVHRIAYLIRVNRENPRGILALAYNRHAAVEIRRRLRELIYDDANGVTVLTCHALAMRLIGASFVETMVQESDFKRVLIDAVRLLRGEGMPPEDADEQRERLLSGFRWILVDEYQDIGPEQYELIAALAGRTLNDPERKLSLFAVGDDDQNVYAFAGASVRYIRQFQKDYQARLFYLTQNYRSTINIIRTANALIDGARNRMKSGHPIVIDGSRQKEPAGGLWEDLDPMGRGRVQILNVDGAETAQAEQVMSEMLRLSKLDPLWEWSNAAVIARQWRLLDPVYAYCQANNIPAQRADCDPPQFWRLREAQLLVEWLSERGSNPLKPTELDNFLKRQSDGQWWELLREAIDSYRLECGDGPLPAIHLKEWLAEWGREIRKRQQGLLLVTAHRVKGLEFDHVAVLDGNWQDRGDDEDPDAACRLYYVAMTRARKTFTLARRALSNGPADSLLTLPSVCMRNAPSPAMPSHILEREYMTLTPANVDIGFAGRFHPRNRVHAILKRLQPGDALQLTRAKEQWLFEYNGQVVGRLARSFNPPQNMYCIQARVHAMLVRFRMDSDPLYADSIECDRWEVVIPELVFAPRIS